MTLTLALETTEKHGSIALLEGRHVLADVRLPQDRRSAQTLTPAMDAILRNHAVRPGDIGLVAVVLGPGSFTGLRVGVTAAKMFAYTTKAKIVGLRTHDVVAQACADEPNTPEFLSVGVDAQRGEVCVKIFRQRAGNYAPETDDTELISVADWWKQAERCENMAFTGPALYRYAAKVPEHVRLSEEKFWMPRAAGAGQMAVEALDIPRFDDVLSLVPIYSRLSAAEERRECPLSGNTVPGS